MKVWLLTQLVEKLSTSGTAPAGEWTVTPGRAARPARSCAFEGGRVGRGGAHTPGPLFGRQAKPDGVGQVFGAGADAALLVAAEVGRAQVLALVFTQIQGADALGRVDFMPRNRQRIDAGQLFQVERDAQPRLHGVDVHGRAAVFRLDTGGQAGDVLHGSGLVVDGHAGHKHGVFCPRRR